MSVVKTASALLVLCMLTACASAPTPAVEGWHAVALPGKAATHYAAGVKDGRAAISAVSVQSASMWRRKLPATALPVDEVSFSWWLERGPAAASVADVSREDAGARVLFGFDGDHARLPMRTRMLFDLAEGLSGERPPYATLMYVWDAIAPVGSVIVNPRSDRIRKIVVDSGSGHARQWRDHRRNLAADFRRAFGEDPGTLLSVAVMTDSDNTLSRAEAWYGPVLVHPASAVQP